MHRNDILNLLEQVQKGALTPHQGVKRLESLPFEDLGFARVDHHRTLRQGFPEVIFGLKKKPGHVAAIVRSLLPQKTNILITRCPRNVYAAVRRVTRKAQYHEMAQAASIIQDATIHGDGIIHVVCAGTSDIPVAEEAVLTARVMGNEVETTFDAGVAGIHRLLSAREALARARAIIVVAGMEGALPSVVGGMVSVPVIAVPTSIGYGSSFGGLTALLAMLNSCASNVTVVNIDNGFGAGFVASLINRKRS
ncbi:MAG: nickel pincer cofactor biosynthesis protein LarB [Acidobacteriia bacterium]|nr:nickel pincer cofactor biosynthesis protein LarB [Terriglobia bacterium]